MLFPFKGPNRAPLEALNCYRQASNHTPSNPLVYVQNLNISLQMILYDTPGIIEKKMHKLDSVMMKNVRSAGINADCVLVVVDACKVPQKIDEVLEEGIGDLKDKVHVLLVLNKKDLIKPGEIAKRLEWYEKYTEVDEVIPVSAKYGQGVGDVKDWILSKPPFGPAYYPKDITSEHPERFFVAEIVREKFSCNIEKKSHMHAKSMSSTILAGPPPKILYELKLLLERTHKRLFSLAVIVANPRSRT